MKRVLQPFVGAMPKFHHHQITRANKSKQEREREREGGYNLRAGRRESGRDIRNEYNDDHEISPDFFV